MRPKHSEVGFQILRHRKAIHTLDTVFVGVDIRRDDGHEELAFIHIHDWNHVRDHEVRLVAEPMYGLLADAATGQSTRFLSKPHRPVTHQPIEKAFVSVMREVMHWAVGGTSDKEVNFWGEPVVFPNWSPWAERTIRSRIAKLGLKTDEDRVMAARDLIVDYLERKDRVHERVYSSHAEALRTVSAHSRKVALARGFTREV